MNSVFLLATAISLVTAESSFCASENDNVDIDAVIEDLSSLKSYVDCLLQRASCTSLTESYRRNIQDSVIRACDGCSLGQKQCYAKFLQGLKTRLPQDYTDFRRKYDPRGIYFDALEAELNKHLDTSAPFLLPYYYI